MSAAPADAKMVAHAEDKDADVMPTDKMQPPADGQAPADAAGAPTDDHAMGTDADGDIVEGVDDEGDPSTATQDAPVVEGEEAERK